MPLAARVVVIVALVACARTIDRLVPETCTVNDAICACANGLHGTQTCTGNVNQCACVMPVTPSITVAGNPFALSAQQTYQASIVALDGLVYAWTVTGGTLSASSGASVSFTAGGVGALLLTVSVTNAGHDSAAPAQLVLAIVADASAPTLDVPTTVTANRNDLLAFVTNPQAGATYTWQAVIGDVTTTLASTGPSATFTSGAAGTTVTVQVQVQNSAGQVSAFVPSAPIAVVAPSVSVIAGTPGGVGNIDGIGPYARFANPVGLASDPAGNLYVADSTNYLIRMITPAGEVTTIAGTLGVQGSADGGIGTGTLMLDLPTVLFQSSSLGENVSVPMAWSQGSLYIADNNASEQAALRKIDLATGVLSTLFTTAAYSAGVACTASSMLGPITGLAADGNSTLYISEQQAIFTLDTSSASAGPVGWSGGCCAASDCTSPITFGSVIYDGSNAGLAYSSGHLFVYDGNSMGLLEVATATATLQTVVLGGQTPAIAADANGNVWLANVNGSRVDVMTPDSLAEVGSALPIAGAGSSTYPPLDGTGPDAVFSGITAMTTVSNATGTTVFVTDVDSANVAIVRSVTGFDVVSENSGVVRAFASAPRLWPGAPGAQFGELGQIAPEGGDAFVVADANKSGFSGDSYLREVALAGAVSNFVGDGTDNVSDGPSHAAQLFGVVGVAADPAGGFAFSSWASGRVQEVSTNSLVHTLAGFPTGLYYPFGLAVGGNEQIFVAVGGNGCPLGFCGGANVSVIFPDGSVVALNSSTQPMASPRSVALISDTDMLVTDNTNSTSPPIIARLLRVTLTGGDLKVVTVVSGGAPDYACTNNVHHATPCASACLRNPTQVLVGPEDTAFIADGTAIQYVQHLSTACTVTTLAGSALTGVSLGDPSVATFGSLSGLALTRSGDLVAADSAEGVMLLIRYESPD